MCDVGYFGSHDNCQQCATGRTTDGKDSATDALCKFCYSLQSPLPS